VCVPYTIQYWQLRSRVKTKVGLDKEAVFGAHEETATSPSAKGEQDAGGGEAAARRGPWVNPLFCGSQSSFFPPPPTYKASPIAIRLHIHCAIYALRNIRPPPPPPSLYAIHHTILDMAISCKGQVREETSLSRARRERNVPLGERILLRNIRPPSNTSFVCRTPYHIGNCKIEIVQRPSYYK